MNSERTVKMVKTDSPVSSGKDVDELIQQAEESMPSCEDDNGDWAEFNRLKMQLESMPYIYTFIIAGRGGQKTCQS